MDLLELPPAPLPSSIPSEGARHRFRGEITKPTKSAASFSTTSTLADLAGYPTIISAETTGEELADMFTQYPNLPGVILFADEVFVGVISQAHFYRYVSRAFGREIYYRRPVEIMLADKTEQALVLPASLPIQQAVDRCLQRPAEFVYEPFLVHDTGADEYRLCAFQSLLFASSEMAALRNRQMEEILNTVTDGLLVIDRQLRIGGEYSKAVDRILERSDLGGKPLPEVLRPMIDPTTLEQLDDYLRILFDPKLIDRLIRTINPAKQIAVRFAPNAQGIETRTKHFSLNFERIRRQGEISQVLVRLEDITSRVVLALELKQQEAVAEEKLQLVLQMLQLEPVALERFVLHFDQELAAMEQMFMVPDEGQLPAEIVRRLFRRAHTLKGEASLLKLTAHERLLHRLEDELEKLRGKPQLEKKDFTQLLPALEGLHRLRDQLDQALNQLRFIDRSSIKRGDQQGGAQARGAQARGAQARGAQARGAQARGAQARGAQMPAALPDRNGASSAPAPQGLLATIQILVSDLSQKLGKPAEFHSSCSEKSLPAEHHALLREALLHLTRNSLVHGIEPVAERVKLGKTPTGVIQLELKTHDNFYEFIYQDDGAGLHLDKIREKAERLGKTSSTRAELLDLIFEPGFSTADKVTDLAGRGVGLDVIRDLVQQAGGRIVPHTEPGAYCAFQLILPKSAASALAA